MVGTVKDITEERTLEEQVQKSEQKRQEAQEHMESILNNMHNIVFLKTAKQYVYINGPYESLLGPLLIRYTRKTMLIYFQPLWHSN